MQLTKEQLAIIMAWADRTPALHEVRLFGSYAKGSAHACSDVDLAISASAGDWTALAAQWEHCLSAALGGLTVNLRTLSNPIVRGYCDECSILLLTREPPKEKAAQGEP